MDEDNHREHKVVRENSLLDPKWVVIHGAGTIYRLSIFKFGGADHEFLHRAGFGKDRRDYIGAVIWTNRPKFVYGLPGSPAFDALDKAGIQRIGKHHCGVLEIGIETILKKFDEIPDGATIRVEPNIAARTLKEFYETSKVEIVEGWDE